jgi:hypothetical protein
LCLVPLALLLLLLRQTVIRDSHAWTGPSISRYVSSPTTWGMLPDYRSRFPILSSRISATLCVQFCNHCKFEGITAPRNHCLQTRDPHAV